MKKIIPVCAALALLLGVSSGASAAVVFDFSVSGAAAPGPIPVPGTDSVTINVAAGAVTDEVLFTIAAPAQLISGTLIVPTTFFVAGAPGGVRLFEQVGGVADLTAGEGGDDILLATAVPVIGPINDNYSFTASLASILPTFYVSVKGAFAAPPPTGSYSVQLNLLLPVPIPPAAILFLSALAGLAGFSRIRRRREVAT